MNNINKLGKISKMMEENQFWKLVEASLKNTSSEAEQEAYLIKVLKSLPLEEIIGFRLRTDKLLTDSYTSEMWCAGYLLNGGCSDDGFEYFRNWLISRGKKVYEAALVNPDTLANEIKAVHHSFEFEFESFWYVALDAFEQKTSKELYEYIDYENFTTREGNYPEMNFNWKEEKPETMKAICPQISERMWA